MGGVLSQQLSCQSVHRTGADGVDSPQGGSSFGPFMSKLLKGKRAVITGGASGIGEATSRAFVSHGAQVVIADVQQDQGERLAAELGQERAVFVQCDVSQEADVAGAVQAAVDRFGGLDVMVNNAGVVGGLGPIADMAVDDFERTLKINLTGVLLGTKYAARAMKAAGTAGVIINTSSISAIGGAPAAAGYTAAKAGVLGLTRQAACELACHGIRACAVAPGITATPMSGMWVRERGSTEGRQEAIERFVAKTSPLKGTLLQPEDIANAILFLASDMGRCVNGHTLVVDCGVVAGVTGKPPAFSRREPGFVGVTGRDAGSPPAQSKL